MLFITQYIEEEKNTLLNIAIKWLIRIIRIIKENNTPNP